jgi:hypothetical protein
MTLVRRPSPLYCIAIFLLAWLTGCTSVAPRIKSDQKLTGQEGAVIFKLINNSADPTDPVEAVTQITLYQIKATADVVEPRHKPSYLLFRNQKTTHTTAVFSGVIPPGRYEVLSASGMHGNTIYTFPLASMVSQFDVKPGEVSLLGTLVIQPLADKKFNVGYVPPDADMQATYVQLFPAMAAQTQGQAFNTIEPTPMMRSRAEFATKSKLISRAINNLFQSDQGDFFYGSKLGTAYWKKAGEKTWRSLDVGSWHEVLTLRMVGRGALVVGGEEGLLRYSVDEGKTWRSLTPPEQGAIHALIPVHDGKVLAMVKNDKQWTAYISSDLLQGRWDKLNSFEHETSFNRDLRVAQSASVVSTDSWVGVLMPNGVLYGIDVKTGQLQRRANTSFSLTNVTMMGDNALLMRGLRWVPAYLVSDNLGHSWSELSLRSYTVAVAVKDRKTLYAITENGTGLTAGEYQLQATRDGGLTWTATGVPPPGFSSVRQMVVDKHDGSLLAFYMNGIRMRSVDEGKTWVKGNCFFCNDSAAMSK